MQSEPCGLRTHSERWHLIFLESNLASSGFHFNRTHNGEALTWKFVWDMGKNRAKPDSVGQMIEVLGPVRALKRESGSGTLFTS